MISLAGGEGEGGDSIRNALNTTSIIPSSPAASAATAALQPQPQHPAAAAAQTVPQPSSSSACYSSSSSLDEQIERLRKCEHLHENEVKSLCLRAREILVDEGNVQRVDAPVTVRLFSLTLSFFVTAHFWRGLVGGGAWMGIIQD